MCVQIRTVIKSVTQMYYRVTIRTRLALKLQVYVHSPSCYTDTRVFGALANN